LACFCDYFIANQNDIAMKRLLILPVAFLLTISASAQRAPERESRKTFSFGPVMGFGHAWMTPTAYSEYNPAISAGVFAIYSPIEHWGLGADVRYSIEGSKKDYPEGGIVKSQFDYIRVPVRAMYFFGKWGDDFCPKLAVGPSFGFLVGSKGPSYVNENQMDFGFTASGGFNYRIYRGTWLNADVGCYHGLSDAVKGDQNKEGQRNIAVNVGVGFEL
jgi:hypothetical protein